MCDHIYRAFPDDVPGSAFVPLTEHYMAKNTIDNNIAWLSILQGTFHTMGLIMYVWYLHSRLKGKKWEEYKGHDYFYCNNEW